MEAQVGGQIQARSEARYRLVRRSDGKIRRKITHSELLGRDQMPIMSNTEMAGDYTEKGQTASQTKRKETVRRLDGQTVRWVT